jgi:hypothetical protein
MQAVHGTVRSHLEMFGLRVCRNISLDAQPARIHGSAHAHGSTGMCSARPSLPPLRRVAKPERRVAGSRQCTVCPTHDRNSSGIASHTA